MKSNYPDVLLHASLNQSIVHPDVIANKQTLLKRFCPHRMYTMHQTGDLIDEITCDLHDWKWNSLGTPLNNDRKLGCGEVTRGRSNLILRNFQEPNHRWVDIIGSETNLLLQNVYTGSSTASWLWLMDLEADYLHVEAAKIHPLLNSQIDTSKIILEEGDGWIYQEHAPGWFAIYIYPFIFLEHKNGCLGINRVVPNDPNSEFGFQWTTQFYFDYSKTNAHGRNLFETMEPVFKEDVRAAENTKGPYFPLMKSDNPLEKHSLHFAKWVTKNVQR